MKITLQIEINEIYIASNYLNCSHTTLISMKQMLFQYELFVGCMLKGIFSHFSSIYVTALVRSLKRTVSLTVYIYGPVMFL